MGWRDSVESLRISKTKTNGDDVLLVGTVPMVRRDNWPGSRPRSSPSQSITRRWMDFRAEKAVEAATSVSHNVKDVVGGIEVG